MSTQAETFDQASDALGALCEYLRSALAAGMDTLIFPIEIDVLPALLELGLDVTPLELPDFGENGDEGDVPSISCQLTVNANALDAAESVIAA
ncbi:MAG: hypothetical protein R3360_02465 [Alphaproteobacteria bacterium]|nr:hypothetical protein [Alphaproteobacteria bacterium]